MQHEIPNNYFRTSIKALILNDEGKFLLVQENEKHGSVWELPGGGLDFGETIESCLRREIQEEMGLEVISIENQPSYFFTFQDHHKVWRTNALYFTKLKNLEFIPSHECVAIRFFNMEEVLENKDKMLLNVLEFVKVFKPK